MQNMGRSLYQAMHKQIIETHLLSTGSLVAQLETHLLNTESIVAQLATHLLSTGSLVAQLVTHLHSERPSWFGIGSLDAQ